MIHQPLAGLGQGFSIRAGGERVDPLRWFKEPEAIRRRSLVDWLTRLEPLEEASSEPGARHHSAVFTAITAHRWDKDGVRSSFSHALGESDRWRQLWGGGRLLLYGFNKRSQTEKVSARSFAAAFVTSPQNYIYLTRMCAFLKEDCLNHKKQQESQSERKEARVKKSSQ